MSILISIFLIAFSGSTNAENPKSLDAYIFIAEECPISIYMASDLRKLYADYSDHCNFHLVFPVRKSSRASAKAFTEQHDLTGMKIIMDRQQDVVQTFEAEVTPEIVIVDKETEQVKYRGRINDAFLPPERRNTVEFSGMQTRHFRLSPGIPKYLNLGLRLSAA
jgi:thiol-disulfide isomerase/thioredoxin